MPLLYPAPVAHIVEKWNGSMGQTGVTAGRDSFEYYGLPLWREDHWLVRDEYGKAQVLTEDELHKYYR